MRLILCMAERCGALTALAARLGFLVRHAGRMSEEGVNRYLLPLNTVLSDVAGVLPANTIEPSAIQLPTPCKSPKIESESVVRIASSGLLLTIRIRKRTDAPVSGIAVGSAFLLTEISGRRSSNVSV